MPNTSDDVPRRELASFTAEPERRLLLAMAARLPPWIHPDHLTLLGFLGMACAGLAYRLSATQPLWLHAVNACLLLNWLGDSLDGTLARYRKRTRPRYGFYVDHMVDAFGALMLCLGLAHSGLAHPVCATALLISYLLLSVHIGLAAGAAGVFRIAYAGLGGTELRIALAAANLLALSWPKIELGQLSFRLFDVLASSSVLALLSLVLVLGVRTAVALDRIEQGPAR